MLNLEFQSTCLAFRSPASRTVSSPYRQTDRSLLSRGQEGETYTARTFTGLPANAICMAVAFRCFRPGTGIAWWSIPRRTRIAVPPPIVGRSVRWQTSLQTERLFLERDVSRLRVRCRHRVGRGSGPAPASSPGRRRRSNRPAARPSPPPPHPHRRPPRPHYHARLQRGLRP